MGFFGGLFGGGGSNASYDRVSALQEQQIIDNKAQLEAKRQNIFKTRLDIIKSQGAQIWNPPGKNTPV